MAGCSYPFGRIKAYYDKNREKIMSASPNNFAVRVYGMDWTSMFSRIERDAWGCIRDFGIVAYPQYPIADMFPDFSSPVLKYVIECDGKDFHDAEKDAARDARLSARGFDVFRIQGAESMRDDVIVEDLRFAVGEASEDDRGRVAASFFHELKSSYNGFFIGLALFYHERRYLQAEFDDCLREIVLAHRTANGGCNG